MGGIDLNKYLQDIPEYTTGRLRYNPVNMLKMVLFGFMTNGYCRTRLRIYSMISIMWFSKKSTLICSIYTLMDPSLKLTQISIHGYGKRLLKSSGTSCTKRLLQKLNRSMKKSNGAMYRFQQIQSIFQHTWQRLWNSWLLCGCLMKAHLFTEAESGKFRSRSILNTWMHTVRNCRSIPKR